MTDPIRATYRKWRGREWGRGKRVIVEARILADHTEECMFVKVVREEVMFIWHF